MNALCWMLSSVALLGGAEPGHGAPPKSSETKHVLVIADRGSKASIEIARYYMRRRSVPDENLLFLTVPSQTDISFKVFDASVLGPVREKLAHMKTRIDYLVTTKGMPLRVVHGRYSVEALLAAQDIPGEPMQGLSGDELGRCANPYFDKHEHFRHRPGGLYLATRLDAYSVTTVKRMIDDSLAAKPKKGPFWFAPAKNKDSQPWLFWNDQLRSAGERLARRGFDASLSQRARFQAPPQRVMGYAGWGSNDGLFDLREYRRIRFLPGALATTFVSTSARTFEPTVGGQSLIADLLEQGCAGAAGYVDEPYAVALDNPDILFDRYVSGFNLAESFWMATPLIKWKEVVLGDPLCCPYLK